MIEFVNTSRRYGDKLAVAGLNLRIPPGELFALLGPNGAGKTTTIRMLVGLLQPSGGQVRICGYDVVSQPREAHRRLGLVPDEPYLYDKLSGREFLGFVADIHGLSRTAAAARIARQIEQFELRAFVDDRTETYSHGMKQRLAFAAALLHEPAVLVVDEPMVGLDPRSVRLVKDLLKLKARSGMTIFMSTHSLAAVEEIADRIGIVDHGQMKFLGTLAELRERSAGGVNTEDKTLERLYLQMTDETEPVSSSGAAAPPEVGNPA